jgi:hypothetical protein
MFLKNSPALNKYKCYPLPPTTDKRKETFLAFLPASPAFAPPESYSGKRKTTA